MIIYIIEPQFINIQTDNEVTCTLSLNVKIKQKYVIYIIIFIFFVINLSCYI